MRPPCDLDCKPSRHGSQFKIRSRRTKRPSSLLQCRPVLIREGCSIRIVQKHRDSLGVDALLLGLALSDAQIHTPNENFPVENFEAGIHLNQALLKQLAL